MIEVVAALIWQGDRFLVCQRPAHKARGLLWEFVGGKVELGESKEQALIRECQEELGITVKVGETFMKLTHVYPDITVHLTLFNSVISRGIPEKLEHNDIRWIKTSEIDNYDFCPADQQILEQLKLVESGLQASLFSHQDQKYKDFQCCLMPTVDRDRVIGVRMPVLRRITKAFSESLDASDFLSALPHRYYEEDNVHGIMISNMSNFQETICRLDAFLPYIDNWATCDLISPKDFQLCPPDLIGHIRRWLRSEHIYTVRFAVGMLMKYYLGDAFSEEYLSLVAGLNSKEYYIKMMVAWYFATALSQQYDAAVGYLERCVLGRWTHNKTIQKALESFRISPEIKDYLRTLKY